MKKPMTKHGLEEDIFEGKTVGQLIGEGLQDFADALKHDRKHITEKFTCHKVTLDLKPTKYDPKMVKTTRDLLNASQAVFAKFLGVSLSCVRAWEQGINVPENAACRLMDEIRHAPDYWRKRMRSLVVKKPRKVLA